MANARDAILTAIRAGAGRQGPLPDARAAELEARLANPRRNLIPARAQLDPAKRLDLFAAMAVEAAATVDRVADAGAVPAALADYLARHNLSTELAMAPAPALAAIPWEGAPLLKIRRGKAEPDDEVGVTPAFAGIAETGTLMLLSGPDHPSTLNLLPDTHVAILPESRVVGSYEDGWDLLRAEHPGAMPRTALFVTGPSRSADIEQTLQMGAHGPRRLHIIMIADDAHGPAQET